jgi:hypothetical protein
MLSSKDRLGIALMGGVVLLIIVVLLVRVAIGQKTGLDAMNCPPSPPTSTVIVIDRSDDVAAHTLLEMRTRANAFIRDSVGEGGRVSIFAISDHSQDSLLPLLSLCKPASTGSRVTSSVKAIQKQFAERFQLPIAKALEIVPGPTPSSPLGQVFIDLSQSEYLRASRNHLLVFSDMMENTPRFSLYNCGDTLRVVERFRASRQGAKERPQFTNTMVSLHLIPRLNLAATSLICRDKLWLWFFGDNPGNNAGLVADYLPGGTPVHKTPPQK